MKASLLLPLLVLAGAAVAAQPTKRPSDAEAGRAFYNRHCVQCHGVAARGDGPAVPALVHPPPDLQGKVKADDPTIQVVLRGRGAMPGFDQSFSADDARRTLAFMAGLTDRPTAPAPEAPAPPPAGEEGGEGGGEEGGGPAGAEGGADR